MSPADKVELQNKSAAVQNTSTIMKQTKSVPAWKNRILKNNAVRTCVAQLLDAELHPICHLLALLGGYHILHVFRIRVKWRLFKKSKKI